MNKKKDVVTIFLGIDIAFIIWITVLNRDILSGVSVEYQPFHAFISALNSIRRGGLASNFLGNIILFIPVGFLLQLLIGKKKGCWVILIGSGFSLLIELVQLLTHRGYFDLDDIMLNTLGTIMGIGLTRLIIILRRKLFVDTDKNSK